MIERVSDRWIDARGTNIEPGLTRTDLGEHIDDPALSAQLDAIFSSVPAPLTAGQWLTWSRMPPARPAHVNLRQAIIQPTM